MSTVKTPPFDKDMPTLDFVVELAMEAGAYIKSRFFQREKKVDFKLSSADLLTETDVAVEAMLKRKITDKYPKHAFLCEESAAKAEMLTDAPTWVIDPIDGTMNFVHTLPLIAVSIGFCVKQEVVHGVIYNPIMDELFYATKGGGAFLKQGDKPTQPIRVAPTRRLAEAVVATGFSASKLHKLEEQGDKLSTQQKADLEMLREVVKHNAMVFVTQGRDLRRTGACAIDMAWTAMGRLDAMCEICPKEWDVAAGWRIIEEAGGAVTNFDGSQPFDPHRRLVLAASSLALCKEMAENIRHPTCDITTLED